MNLMDISFQNDGLVEVSCNVLLLSGKNMECPGGMEPIYEVRFLMLDGKSWITVRVPVGLWLCRPL